MTTLNDFNYVDDSDDVMAVHVNNLVASSLRSEYKNAESLSATRTLLDVDTPLQRFDCNGANRIVKMPTADSVENHPYLIFNSTASGTYTLTVQNNGATITHAVLNPSEFIFMLPDGDGTYVVFGMPFKTTLTPAQITSNQDNYNPTGAGAANVLRVSCDAARSITGLGFPAQNKTIILENVGGYTITLVNNATSTAANRFLLGADFELEADKSVILIYDSTSSRWRMVGGGGSAATSTVDISIVNFRLTLASATPVTTTDQTAKTTIYCTPFKGNRIALYDGAEWAIYTSAEFSLALGTLTSGKPYDVFCYANSGVPTLEFLVWTDATTRATALTTQDGVLVKTGATTRRYLGTFYTVSATTVEDSNANRLLWNFYNQVPRPLYIKEATDNWSYTTTTYRNVNNSSSNALKVITGQSTLLSLTGALFWATSASGARMAFGEDGTSVDPLCVGIAPAGGSLSATPTNMLITWLQKYPSVGYHVYNWLERGNTGVTFYGDNGDTTIQQSGVHGWIMG